MKHMPFGWNGSARRRWKTRSRASSKAIRRLPSSVSAFASRIPAMRPGMVAGSMRSGASPSRPSSTALSLPWPLPVAPSEPNSSARTAWTRSSRPSSPRPCAKRSAARIGPTVCELEGPMPILNRSKTLMATGSLSKDRARLPHRGEPVGHDCIFATADKGRLPDCDVGHPCNDTLPRVRQRRATFRVRRVRRCRRSRGAQWRLFAFPSRKKVLSSDAASLHLAPVRRECAKPASQSAPRDCGRRCGGRAQPGPQT